MVQHLDVLLKFCNNHCLGAILSPNSTSALTLGDAEKWNGI